jgi:glucose/arabinose dehydrogenase
VAAKCAILPRLIWPENRRSNMRNSQRWFAGAALTWVLAACAADTGPVRIESEKLTFALQTVATGLEHPWGMAILPDGRVLVSERPGRLRLIGPDGRVSAPLAGVSAVVAKGQGGLLDVALHPDFDTNHLVYFSFSEPADRGDGNSTAVARGRLEGNALHDVQVIFRQQPKFDSSAHFGSRLVFARDGTLFVTLGDRYHRRDDAQTLDNHHGKVVRIRDDGSTPPDNPFVANKGALPQIWSYGHRNLQGAALHPVTGELWTHEHGPRGGDELNVDRAGRNYGWPVITYGKEYIGGSIGEGTRKDGLEQPLKYWVPSIAPSGMTFVDARIPAWQGNVLIGSLAFKQLVRLELDGEKVVHEERLLKKEPGERIRDVEQGPDGAIYLLTDEADGKLLRIK